MEWLEGGGGRVEHDSLIERWKGHETLNITATLQLDALEPPP